MSGLFEAKRCAQMLVMLDTPQNLDICALELGCEVEQLFTPLTRRNPQQPDHESCFYTPSHGHA